MNNQPQFCNTSIKSRNSSIELLRILAACAVVVLHYNGMGGALKYSSGLSHELLVVLECFCVCAVDLFVMISGYFLCMTYKRTWDKPIYLLLVLSIIVSASYILKSLNNDFNVLTLIHALIPPKNYFVVLYLTLYIISPAINMVLTNLSAKGRTTLLIVLMLLFSVYPTIIDSYQMVIDAQPMGTSTVGAWGQQHGYTIVGFSLFYTIGAWIRMNNIRIYMPKSLNALLVLFILCCIYGWFKLEEIVCAKDLSLIDYNSLSYANPLVISLASLLLIFFSNIQMNSKVINSLAKAAFVCYIFHLNVMPYLRINLFASIGGGKLFLHLIISLIIIYLISWVICSIIDILFAPLKRRLKAYNLYTIE